jgi:D-alanyl-D-alanine carboxypeptidase-like protein
MLQTTPVGLDEIIAAFGRIEEPTFEAAHIVSFDLPYPLLYAGQTVSRARCHRLLVQNFQKAFYDLAQAGLADQVKNYGGIYARRAIRGQAAHPSTHSWGIAIDLEPADYPLGSSKRFPDQVVQIFADAGFFYGGDFKSRKDPMHFQFAKGY